MHYILLQYILLLAAVVLLIMLAQKIRIAYPVFLVIAGLLMGYIPRIPEISIDPDLIFLIFLPPLLFEAAWYTSWNDLWKWRGPISLLSVGLVIFTSGIVAIVSEFTIPGFTLALGFVLGGIISPPDAIASTLILKHLKIPKRITAILEGESLMNDASGLIILKFALAAVITGNFSFDHALSNFFVVTLMGILTGLAVAYVMYAIHRYLPTTASIDAVFTLITPYFIYLTAEEFHFSGVMAVVSGGLFLSYRSHEIFMNGQSRLQVISVWSTLIIIMNGLVFIMIGLQLPGIVKSMGTRSLSEALKYSFTIAVVVIVIRMLWIYTATFLPRRLFKSLRTTEPQWDWRSVFVIGWAGMRGVVSLAAALSLPTLTDDGRSFPQRELIVFISFVVILVTLIFQGLSLPWIIKGLKLKNTDTDTAEDQQLAEIQLHLTRVSLAILQDKYALECEGNELVNGYKTELEHLMAQAAEHLRCMTCGVSGKKEIDQYNNVLKDIYRQQRQALYQLKKEKSFSDELLRREEKQIDFNEARILER
ncbi:Na+/H+ antiporter [Mucilaginibacter lutimaris]|uniref:Na+/H+ antiporter n=1 Tax=Mucilaginibacter lutimaris TaxID=931629 RepID=A0ABW2ZEJ5_9SPHI